MTPEEREIIREFLYALTLEEERVRRDLSTDNIGIAFRTAINELDWYVWNYAQQQEPTAEQEEQYYLISLGVVRLIRLMLEIHDSFSFPALTLRRQSGPFRRVLEVVSHLGFIQHGRRVVDMAFAGVCQAMRSTTGRFEFILPAGIVNHGAVEADVNNHFAHETARVLHKYMQRPEGRNLQTVIDELHHENVFVSREHFIGYGADQLLDRYYFQIAWTDLRNAKGFDSFNELREFGGIIYLKYTLAAAIVISLCLKHEAFCRAMVKKHPEVRMEDILTISADRAEFIDSIREGLDHFGRDFLHYTPTTAEQAEQIFETITVTRRNSDMLDGAFPALPCIIEFAQGGIVKCLAGRYRQMEFLLNALRRAYPREYDAHQQLREASFQTVVEDLLGSSFPDLEMRRNIKLRKGGRELTDVDLTVIDPQQGHLLLIQLKFQDSAGSDFSVEASRMGRFRDESVRWLDAAAAWLNTTDEQTLRSTFRIPKGTRINRIRKLVIGRHHAWSLRSVRLDDDTVFASWNQLINAVVLMKKQQGDFCTLNGLHKILRTYIVHTPDRYHRDEGSVEFILDSLKFAVVQADPAELSPPAAVGAGGT
jgi:hypothetical protein